MYSLILHGRRLVQLQTAFFSSTTGASLKGKKFTVSYLVDSLGFTPKLAESISRKVSLEDKVNPDSVLNLLRSHGFANSQISTIISDYPKLLLTEDAEKSLGPKLEFLKSRGAEHEFTQIVTALPKILGKKEGKSISVYYEIIKEIIEADKSSKKVKVCNSLAEGYMQENKIRNLLVLRELGMPQRLLFNLLISNFGTLCGKDKFEEALNKVVEMGFDPTTLLFVKALNTLYQMSDETIEEKVNVYQRLGFDVSDVWAMFKSFPDVLSYSEKKILNSLETFQDMGFSRQEFVMMVKRSPPCVGRSAESVKEKTEFLVKHMNWPLKTVAMFPQVLGYNMEKRIVPRCNVIKALMSKNLLGSELPPLGSVLPCTDQVFLDRYVVKHDEKLVLELMAILNNGRVS